MANSERTFIAIKPDGVQRGLVGEIIKRFEQKGFRLVAMKFMQVWEGLNIVKTGRVMLGETNPADSKPGTIRGDFCIQVGRNIIHGSDSVESAEKEIALWFHPEELHYIDLKDRPFFPGLVKYMNSGPIVAMVRACGGGEGTKEKLMKSLFPTVKVWEGLNVVKTGRVMLGETNPADSKPGTIRGDFCIQVGRNIIHGSDSVKSAEKEISLWFKPEELVEYKSCAFDWIYE
ncbi:hypothetical protein E2I00_011334 [Balaenoptera physalus]|uniref:Nucleoside diphosphate kinase n=1 Tax=Balaenoptera physalus TaxID=9770 RepID=A0A643BQC6_BALPH|nr:hypothetical protein E2I00_011334 [Balaenoptera physalus]